MASCGKFFLLTLYLSASSYLLQSVDGQGFFFKNQDITQYEIRNGKYRIVTTTTTTTTTPRPSMMETFFPWTGTAYNSVRTPEEDEALINSLSDPPPPDTGIMSYLPSMPSLSMPSMPSMPSIPGFRGSSSSSSSAPPPPPPRMPPYPSNGYPYPPPPPGPPMNYNGYPPPGPPSMMGAASNIQPVVVPPPGQENQLGMQWSSPFPPSQFPDQYPVSSPMSYPVPQQPPNQEMPSSQDPTFEFHKAMKDSINIPTPSLPNFGQPSSFAFPGSKQSSSIIDMISSYFSFGKRSDDLGKVQVEARNMNGGGLNRFMMQRRSNDEDVIEIAVDEGDDDYGDHGDSGKDDMDDGETKEGEDGEGAEETKATNPAEDKPYACPKGGIWRWNGEVCIAVGPVPIWACRPNDLVVSGKIAICRNKIFFSPKVINNIQATKLSGRL